MRSELNIPALSIASSEQDGVQVVTLQGELDLRGVGELETVLAVAGESGRVCLNLSELRFIDSTGLATVIRAHQALAGSGGRLVVVCSTDGAVRRAFETTGLMTLLSVTSERGAALQELG
ncbi:MAG TPA: STAS domain-containing protein [Solirubrobacteraceae bacterium]|nr:STAS domain-containing protein [Solirubrobacteraceae bacterium]